MMAQRWEGRANSAVAIFASLRLSITSAARSPGSDVRSQFQARLISVLSRPDCRTVHWIALACGFLPTQGWFIMSPPRGVWFSAAFGMTVRKANGPVRCGLIAVDRIIQFLAGAADMDNTAARTLSTGLYVGIDAPTQVSESPPASSNQTRLW